MPSAVDPMTAEVGTDVESLCSKCGDVWHIVLTKQDEMPDKCECKECGRKHKFKPTDPDLVALIKARKKKTTKKKATKKKTSKKASTKLPEVVIDESLPLIPYDMRATFEVADQIDHKKFGPGVVMEVIEPNKMKVNFIEGGARTLLYAHQRN